MIKLHKNALLLIAGIFMLFTGCEKEPSLPKLNPHSVTEISANSAKSGGDITDYGGALVTDCGIVWGTSKEPTTDDNDRMTNEGEATGSSQVS